MICRVVIDLPVCSPYEMPFLICVSALLSSCLPSSSPEYEGKNKLQLYCSEYFHLFKNKFLNKTPGSFNNNGGANINKAQV